LETKWRDYVQRSGLKTAFDMLIGLSKQHNRHNAFWEPSRRLLLPVVVLLLMNYNNSP
jgi:hypothetical protein